MTVFFFVKRYKSKLAGIKLHTHMNSMFRDVFTISCRCSTLALIYNFLIARCKCWHIHSLCAVRLTLQDVGLLTSGPTDCVSSETVNDDTRYTVRHLTSTDWLSFYGFFFSPQTARCKLNLASSGWSASIIWISFFFQ